MEPILQTPYFVRAIHEWCEDSGFTAHLFVVVTEQTHVPMAYVKDGEIVLNISYGATKQLNMTNEHIAFSARFAGQPYDIYVPMSAVKGIVARENGQGMFFEVKPEEEPRANALEVVSEPDQKSKQKSDPEKKSKKPTLKVIK